MCEIFGVRSVCVEEGTRIYSRILETGEVRVGLCYRVSRVFFGFILSGGWVLFGVGSSEDMVIVYERSL